MSKATIKTNNDKRAIEAKIQLRINSLPKKDTIYVLECYGGENILWNKIKKLSDKNIIVYSIDIKKYNNFQMQGDSLKVIKSIDLSKFDIIDLDSYGIPFDHLEIVFKKQYKGVVHCTVIQSMMGNLPNGLLEANGYTKKMFSKCRTLFSKNGFDKFKNYLAINKVKSIELFNIKNKNYLWFYIV